jgi:hypothetical protein
MTTLEEFLGSLDCTVAHAEGKSPPAAPTLEASLATDLQNSVLDVRSAAATYLTS